MPNSTSLTPFYIALKFNPRKVMAVKDQIDGASVVLEDIQKTTYHNIWYHDVINKTIINASSGSNLVLQLKGDKTAIGTPLVIANLPSNNQPTIYQQWSTAVHLGGYITSLADTNLVVDDSMRRLKDGNEIWAWNFNGSPAQQWKFVPAEGQLIE